MWFKIVSSTMTLLGELANETGVYLPGRERVGFEIAVAIDLIDADN
jgi:L-cysteine desulfidase